MIIQRNTFQLKFGKAKEAIAIWKEIISELSKAALKEMERRYFMHRSEIAPQVFWRLTDNWLEMAVRFVTKEFGTRRLKDRMSREILGAFDEAGLEIASATYDVVGMPPIRVEMQPPAPH